MKFFLGFGVWGLGFGVWGLGFGVWGPGKEKVIIVIVFQVILNYLIVMIKYHTISSF